MGKKKPMVYPQKKSQTWQLDPGQRWIELDSPFLPQLEHMTWVSFLEGLKKSNTFLF
jgi:hypothetical protein